MCDTARHAGRPAVTVGALTARSGGGRTAAWRMTQRGERAAATALPLRMAVPVLARLVLPTADAAGQSPPPACARPLRARGAVSGVGTTA